MRTRGEYAQCSTRKGPGPEWNLRPFSCEATVLPVIWYIWRGEKNIPVCCITNVLIDDCDVDNGKILKGIITTQD